MKSPLPLEVEEETTGTTSDSSSTTGCDGCDWGCVPAVSNFSIQYNYTCASIATLIMLSHDDQTGHKVLPDFEEPQWAKRYLLDMVFTGSVVGMVVMGYLGDLIGIPRALFLTNSLTVIGALASALLSWGNADTVWIVIAVSRFVLGAGVGGNYPLSAAKAAESTPTPKGATDKAAGAFFWQGPGSCAPYLVALLVLLLPSSGYRTSLQFRLILGLGAIPSLVVLLASMSEDHERPPVSNSKAGRCQQFGPNVTHSHNASYSS
jgi:MFS family permease